jgi:hypothetical protein
VSAEGDRKAYYETSQWTIRQNRDTINSMRIENKKLRENISVEKKVKRARSLPAMAL